MGLTPDKVVDAAAELADEDGLAELSLSALAKRLNVRVPSLYKHVDGLDDLVRRVAADGAAGLSAEVAARVPDVRGAGALAAFAAAYRGYARAHPGRYAAVMRHDPAGTTAGVDALLAEIVAGYGAVGAQAADGTRAVRAALHGFVLCEQAGMYAIGRSAEQSFAGLLRLLDNALGGAGGDRHVALRLPGLGTISLPGLPRLSR